MSTLESITIRPMGDRSNDGQIQLSFTLPVGLELAHVATAELCKNMNLVDIQIAHMQPLNNFNTYVQVFAKTNFDVKISLLPIDQKPKLLSRDEIIKRRQYGLARIKIIGACTGTDAHTVGLDAILNKKGYKGEKGLESYPFCSVVNLGSQIKNIDLIRIVEEKKAQVLLISQVITHQNVHLHNLTELMDMLEATNLRKNLLCIIGGPRITHQLALELGFDAGFGLGTTALNVVNFICFFFERKKI